MLLVFFFFRIYIYWTNIRFILRYFKSKLCRLFNFLIANLYLYLDNSLTGESFPASTINPMTMLGDEIINGKLVKNTLSGNFESLSGKKLIQQVPELLLFHQWMTKHRYGNININKPWYLYFDIFRQFHACDVYIQQLLQIWYWPQFELKCL